MGQGSPQPRPRAGDLINIEVEILAGDLFIGAVGDDFVQRLVEALAQGVVVLAHGNRRIGIGAVYVTDNLAAVIAGFVDS